MKEVQLLASDLPKLVMAGALSKSTTFSIRVDGPFGRREAKNLLTYLAVQLEVLSEDGEPNAEAPDQDASSRAGRINPEPSAEIGAQGREP